MSTIAVVALVSSVALAGALTQAVRRMQRARRELKARERRWWNGQELAPLAADVSDEEQVS